MASLSQEDEGGRNVNIARSIAGRFRDFSRIQGCEEFDGGTSLPGSFRGVLEETTEAHGTKKAVKIISSALYLVLMSSFRAPPELTIILPLASPPIVVGHTGSSATMGTTKEMRDDEGNRG